LRNTSGLRELVLRLRRDGAARINTGETSQNGRLVQSGKRWLTRRFLHPLPHSTQIGREGMTYS